MNGSGWKGAQLLAVGVRRVKRARGPGAPPRRIAPRRLDSCIAELHNRGATHSIHVIFARGHAMIDFEPSEDQRLMRDSVAQFAKSTLAPRVREFERDRGVAEDVRKLAH